MDYGIIGNCKTCALINKRAGIDWMCFPTFSSPGVFARLLDQKKGGRFEIAAKGSYKTRQEYLEDTNVLQTFFESETGRKAFVVVDFFPRYRKLLPNRKKKLFRQNRMIRIIKPLKGKPVIKVRYEPRLNYAKGENEFRIIRDNLICANHEQVLSLISNVNYDTILKQEYFELNHKKYFVIGDPDNPDYFNVAKCLRLMHATKRYWKRWVSTLVLPEQNRDIIIRSALVLKLLTFSESGAVLAAATTSLPEELGSVRTWDYRFCWVRDASFAVDSLKKIGRDYEAKKLMEFIFEQTIKKKQRMQIMYGINGETRLTEEKLEHLEGYKESRPVRTGNAAYLQKQNDIYGSIIDVLYLYYVYYEYEKKMPQKYWRFLNYLVKEIKNHWREPDHGIWEFRGVKKHFTYSKLMCWVGIDRAIRIAQHYEKSKQAEKWSFLRDRIKDDILKNAWNEKARAFTIAYDEEALDAAVLLMCYHNFLEPDDPRLISTVNKIQEKLAFNNTRKGAGRKAADNSYLVQRYKIEDDFGKSGTAFSICTFWLIDALCEIGQREKAVKIFRKINMRANHLGLFSEGIDLETKKLRGNFPQAYTHLALINTSILLSEWSARRRKIDMHDFPNRIRLG